MMHDMCGIARLFLLSPLLVACLCGCELNGCGSPVGKVIVDYETRTRHSSKEQVPDDVVLVRAKLIRLRGYDPDAIRNTLLKRYTADFEVVAGVLPTCRDCSRIELRILDPMLGGNLTVGQIITLRFFPDGRLVDIAEFPPGIDAEDLWRGTDTVE